MRLSCRALFLILTFIVSSQVSAIENPLKLQVRFNLEEGTSTIHKAAQYFIEPHGYRVQYVGSAPSEAIAIASKQLPINLPYGKLLTIESALLELLHTDQKLIIDTQNKLISFGGKSK